MPALQGLAYGKRIGIFQMPAGGQAAGNAAYLDILCGQESLEVKRSNVSFNAGICGDNYLAYLGI